MGPATHWFPQAHTVAYGTTDDQRCNSPNNGLRKAKLNHIELYREEGKA